jgi:FAD:protein FMN transferase
MMLSRRHAVLGLLTTPLLWRSTDAVTRTRPATAFGTTVRLTVTAGSAVVAETALDAGFAEIRGVESAFSLFNPASELSRLNAQGELINPSSRMRHVLSLTDSMWEKTVGAFDPTVQPLWQLWASRQGVLPDAAQIKVRMEAVGWQHVSCSTKRVQFARKGMALTFNGIAQGYAADRVAAALRQHDVIAATIDTGERGLVGAGRGAHLPIRDPRDSERAIASFELRSGFIATSGDYATAFTPDFSAHHIFDPATGFSPHELSSVTVAAPTGAEADAMATAMMVMGSKPSLALAAAEGLQVCLVAKDGTVRQQG